MKALISTVCLLLVACGNETEAPKPGLELLDAGGGEKHKLRYAPKEGTKYELVLTMEMDLGTGLKPPATSFTMEILVNSVSAEGDIDYGFRFTSIDVDGQEAPPQFRELLKVRGSAVVSSRGVNKSGKVDLPDSAPESLKQMMSKFEEQIRQMSCPFPHEPVGVGAKWKLTQVIDTPAFTLNQFADYELVEFDGTRGKLKLTLTQSAKDQEMKGLAIKATLVSLASKGTGELEFDLSKPIPVNSNVEISSNVHVAVKEETHEQEIKIKISIKEK